MLTYDQLTALRKAVTKARCARRAFDKANSYPSMHRVVIRRRVAVDEAVAKLETAIKKLF